MLLRHLPVVGGVEGVEYNRTWLSENTIHIHNVVGIRKSMMLSKRKLVTQDKWTKWANLVSLNYSKLRLHLYCVTFEYEVGSDNTYAFVSVRGEFQSGFMALKQAIWNAWIAKYLDRLESQEGNLPCDATGDTLGRYLPTGNAQYSWRFWWNANSWL